LRGRRFYICSFTICFILALIVKQGRGDYWGVNDYLDILLGSSPSFLYLFGIASFVPIITEIKLKEYTKSVLALTLGALIYEIEQNWTAMNFDLGDIVATVMAGAMMMLLHYRPDNNHKLQ